MNKRMNLGILFLLFVLLVMSIFSSAIHADATPKIRSVGVHLNTSKVTMGVGDIIELEGIMNPINSTDTLSWSSSNKSVATVNKYGIVTAKSAGTVTITVKTSSKKKAECIVKVKKYLGKKEIEELITSKLLAKDDILALIEEKTLSEETVLKLINENMLTKEDLEALPGTTNIYSTVGVTESRVLELIKENTSVQNNDSNISNVSPTPSVSDKWEDGTDVPLYQKQSLPFTISPIAKETIVNMAQPFEHLLDYEHSVKINKIEVKKYHVDAIPAGRYQYTRYKYSINCIGSTDYPMDKDKYLRIWYTLCKGGQAVSSYYDTVKVKTDGTFEFSGEYYLDSDIDSIYLKSAEIVKDTYANELVKEIKFVQNSYKGEVGEKQNIEIKQYLESGNEVTHLVKWTVADPKIIEVVQDDKYNSVWIVGLKPGTTTITAEVDGIQSYCEVTISNPDIVVEDIWIDENSIEGTLGDALKFYVKADFMYAPKEIQLRFTEKNPISDPAHATAKIVAPIEKKEDKVYMVSLMITEFEYRCKGDWILEDCSVYDTEGHFLRIDETVSKDKYKDVKFVIK